MQPSTRLLKLKANNELNADKTLEKRRHFETIDANRATQETILKAFKSLVAYLDNPQRVTKTSIVNQLSSVGTPDALKVAEAVKELHNTVKTHKNTDLSEIASLLKSVLAEVKKVPKDHNKIDIPSPVDNTKQFASLEQAIKAVDRSIKEQKLVAEAPIVNVPKFDFKPLEKLLREVIVGVNKEQPIYKEPYKLVDDSVPVVQTNQMIQEKFDRYKIFYDEFSDDEPVIESIVYYLGKEKKATLKYNYNDNGLLVEVYKV